MEDASALASVRQQAGQQATQLAALSAQVELLTRQVADVRAALAAWMGGMGRGLNEAMMVSFYCYFDFYFHFHFFVSAFLLNSWPHCDSWPILRLVLTERR